MAPIGKLYTYPQNVRAYKALIAAKYTGAEIELPEFTFSVTNATPEFLGKFPLGKVPAFVTAAGEGIYESDAIAYYVAALNKEAGLLGRTPVEEALVQTFIHFAANEVLPSASQWIYPILGFMPYNKQSHEKAVADIKRVFGVLNTVLADKTFLVGHAVTLADIVLVMSLSHLFRLVLDPAFRAQYVNVTRYFTTLINQPNFKAVAGEFTFAEKTAVYEPKKEEKKKEEKKPKEEKPKEEKPKAAPAPAADDEEEEESYEEKRGKNPLDELAPSTFNLEAWKRFYSNNEEEVALKYFWDNFDRNGFSLWRCSFRFNEENQKIFMTNNLLSGFLRSLDGVRKYAFGSFGVFGVDNDNEIHGLWVFRGADVPAEVKESPSYESYSFTKVEDVDAVENRETVNAFFAWKEIPGVAKFHNVSNKAFAEGKNYK